MIIGAPRSGTNLLRDLLCASPRIATWPCDEINYLWRHGDPGRATDEFTADDVSSQLKSYLRSKFARLAKTTGRPLVLEKTCANCLRVEFVQEVLPEAKFIYLYRDGRDVVASARQRWSGNISASYLLKKVRYVPLRDMPFYVRRFAGDRFYRLLNQQRQARVWGPRFSGMQSILQSHSLETICARQWRACVDAADQAKRSLPTEHVHSLHYETLVAQPAAELAKLSTFLNTPIEAAEGPAVSNKSVGRWKHSLRESVVQEIMTQISPTLDRLGYLTEPIAYAA